MKFGYITVSRGNTWVGFYITGHYHTEAGWRDFPERGYTGYSIREALRHYKAEYGLKGKHNIEIKINI